MKFENNWMSKSLESLEKKTLPGLNSDEGSYLIRTVHGLRKKQLKNFEVEDLRIMIGQDIGLKFLLPLAVELLNEDILIEGDYYPGDLLSAVLTSNKEFWEKNPAYWKKVIEVLDNQLDKIENEETSFEMKREWYEKINSFKALHS